MRPAFATAGTDAVPAGAHGEAPHAAAPTVGSAAAALPAAGARPLSTGSGSISSRHAAHLLEVVLGVVSPGGQGVLPGVAAEAEVAGHRRGASGGQLAPLERLNCLPCGAC